MRRLCGFLVIACLLEYTVQKSTPESDSYVAAVVEYEVQADVETNLQNYIQLIRDAAAQNADVVVFPEMTLTRAGRSVLVPINGLLKEHSIPALSPDLYDDILVRLSAAAREHEVYVLVNVQEDMDCTSNEDEYCPEQKQYIFNTNVVFDRTGAVIDRYRKINLFGEFTRTPALKPDLGVFTTDFGVTFGHFICFDLMFQVPAVQIVEKMNISNVIFSTMWFSEMPYLTAVQIQQAYAYAMDVNFIAAGANNVAVGSAGSGIYSGKAGALVSIMPGVPKTSLLVSRVPKIPGQVTDPYPGPIYDDPSDQDGLFLLSDPSLPSHVSRPLVPGFQEFTLVDKEVSCRFRVKLTERGEASHHYRAFVQDGKNVYSRREVGLAVCSVVACKTTEAKTCANRFDLNDRTNVFEELEIQMSTYRHHYNTTLKCDDVVYFPSSLRNNKFPLNPINFTLVDNRVTGEFTENEVDEDTSRKKVSIKMNGAQDDIVSFGVWGRIYNEDVNSYPTEVTEEDVKEYINTENRIYGF